MKALIFIATVLSVFTFLFWSYMPKGFFYIGIAIVLMLLSIIIFNHYKGYFWSFFLICGTANNLIDEMFFDNTKLGWNELALIIVIPAIWLIKARINDRKTKPI